MTFASRARLYGIAALAWLAPSLAACTPALSSSGGASPQILSLASVSATEREDGAIVVGISATIYSPDLRPTSWFELVREDGTVVDRSPRAKDYARCRKRKFDTDECTGQPGYYSRMVSAKLVAPAKGGRFGVVLHTGQAVIARWTVVAASIPCFGDTVATVVDLDRGVYIQRRDSPHRIVVDRWTSMDVDAAWIATWQSGEKRVVERGRDNNIAAALETVGMQGWAPESPSALNSEWRRQQQCAFRRGVEAYSVPKELWGGAAPTVQIDREGAPTIVANLESGGGEFFGSSMPKGPPIAIVESRTMPQSPEAREALARVPPSPVSGLCNERHAFSSAEVRAVMRSRTAAGLRHSLCGDLASVPGGDQRAIPPPGEGGRIPFSVLGAKLDAEVRARGGPWTSAELPP